MDGKEFSEEIKKLLIDTYSQGVNDGSLSVLESIVKMVEKLITELKEKRDKEQPHA